MKPSENRDKSKPGKEPARQNRALPWLLAAAALAAVALGFAFHYRQRIFWDFRLCYAAAALYQHGQNPYDNRVLFSIPNLDPMPFAYPLPTTFLFLPLARLEYPLASMVWFCANSLLLGLLVFVWWRQFNGRPPDPRFPLLALLVFNLAVVKALVTGNVVVVETVLTWAAFLFLARGNLAGFVGLLAPAASLKMAPLLFLGLPLAHPQVRRWKAVAAGAALFAGYLAAAYALAPDWFKDYRANVSFNLKEWSQADVLNPSSYALSRRLVSTFLIGSSPGSGLWLSGLFDALIVAPILWVSWKVARALAARPWTEASRPVILFATLVYALVVPRLSDYSFILVIPAALYAVARAMTRMRAWYLIAALLLPLLFISFRDPVSGNSLGGDFYFGAWGYWNLLMVFVCWALLARKLLLETRRQTAPVPKLRGGRK